MLKQKILDFVEKQNSAADPLESYEELVNFIREVEELPAASTKRGKLRLPIEVGKKYVCRDGSIVTIVPGRSEHAPWPFIGIFEGVPATEHEDERRCTYTAEGKGGARMEVYRKDIVAQAL